MFFWHCCYQLFKTSSGNETYLANICLPRGAAGKQCVTTGKITETKNDDDAISKKTQHYRLLQRLRKHVMLSTKLPNCYV